MAGEKRSAEKISRTVIRILLLGNLLSLSLTAPAEERPETAAIERGEYILRVAGCVTCHTESPDRFLAGGRVIESPFGTFFGPNITPDHQTGIGTWRFSDFERSLREGKSPAGKHYYPVFPYTSYAAMRTEDMQDLWAYLQSVDPVYQYNRSHELVWYARFRPALAVWKWQYLDDLTGLDASVYSDEKSRGAYLAQIGHCAECHTPRSWTGGRKVAEHFSGAELPDGSTAPNITPDRENGIGRWRPHHLLRYLDIGMTPEGDFAGGSMAHVIEDSTRFLTPEDRRALVVFLLDLETAH